MKTITWPILDSVFFKKNLNEAEQFTLVFKKYQSLVRSVIFQIAGESALNDLSQEAFVRIWKGFPKFRNESEVTSWIYRICVNVALDFLREKKRKPVDYDYDFTTHAAEGLNIEDELSQRQTVQQSLAELSDEHRAVVVLAWIHERPLLEVSQILDVSEGTVKSRLFYAKEQLRQLLRKETV